MRHNSFAPHPNFIKGTVVAATVGVFLVMGSLPAAWASVCSASSVCPSVQAGWPVDVGGNSEGIAIGDVDYDGDLEVVVTVFGAQGKTFVFHHDGTLTLGWPQVGHFRAPSVQDIDGDGTLEIFSTLGSWVYAYYHDGQMVPGWPKQVEGCAAVPSIDDLDGDGAFEIAVGTADGCGIGASGKFYLFDAYGNLKPGWPVLTPNGFFGIKSQTGVSAAFHDFDGDDVKEIVWTSISYLTLVYKMNGTLFWSRNIGISANADPAIGDINGDGVMEVIHGSDGGAVFVLRGTDGTNIPGWPKTCASYIQGAVALVDLEQDGNLQVLASNLNTTTTTCVWNGDGSVYPGWPKGGTSVAKGTPTVGDLTGDGKPDITTNGGDMTPSSRVMAWNASGTSLPGFPFDYVNIQFDQPFWIGDLDLDGDVEMGTAARQGSIFGGKDVYFWDLPAKFDPMANEWPMYGRTMQRTNFYEPPSAYIPRVDAVTPVSWTTCEPPNFVEVAGAYYESKPFVWFVPEEEAATFFSGDLSKGIPAASVTMDPALPRKGARLEVAPPALPRGQYQLVVQNPTGIRNVWPKPNSPAAPAVTVEAGSAAEVADIDGDGRVDGQDIGILSRSFGCYAGEDCYDAAADIDRDGEAGFLDLVLLAPEMGSWWSCP